MRTVCNGMCSGQLATSHGIRQGGVISPVLFYVYIDALWRKKQKIWAAGLVTISLVQ